MRPILVLEDKTRVLDTTGDLDAFEHGGGVLFQEPKRKEVYWQFWGEREMGEKNYAVFTAPIPSNIIEIYEPDIRELCQYSELEIQTVRRLARSKDPKERLQIVMALREVYGASALDPNHEPEILTPWELAHRWGDVFGKELEGVAEVEYDDYIIRESNDGRYECGCVDGTYFGHYEKYKHCLCVIAQHMQEIGDPRPNVMHEHDRGKVELVLWDPAEFLSKNIVRKKVVAGPRWRAHMRIYVNGQKIADGIAKRAGKTKSIMKKRKQAAQRLRQKDNLERAKAMRRSLESI